MWTGVRDVLQRGPGLVLGGNAVEGNFEWFTDPGVNDPGMEDPFPFEKVNGASGFRLIGCEHGGELMILIVDG